MIVFQKKLLSSTSFVSTFYRFLTQRHLTEIISRQLNSTMITCHAVLCGIPFRVQGRVCVRTEPAWRRRARTKHTAPLLEILMGLFVHEFCRALFICGPKRDFGSHEKRCGGLLRNASTVILHKWCLYSTFH